MIFRRSFSLIISLLFSSALHATLTIPTIFQQHMVLQRAIRIPVWGWDTPEKKVTVTLNGKSAAGIADKDGAWKVLLPKMKAGGPYELNIADNEQHITIDDVLIGEVWLCSGQSNMEMGVNAVANGKEEVAVAKYPQIRLFFGGGSIAEVPQTSLENSNWWVCGPDTVGYFSAIGYFFAQEIHLKEQVPLGIINVSWSGSRIEGWIPRAGYLADSTITTMLDTVKAPLAATMPTTIYNSRIHPLVPFALRGVLWYQGESNVQQAEQYQHLLPALITGWRNAWGEGDFPFLIVQLPNYQAIREQPSESNWAELREAQVMACALPNTELAVTTDIGEADNIHPKNKKEVAHRLALIALSRCYGEKTAFQGPEFLRMKLLGATIRLYFTTQGGELLTSDGDRLRGFAIAGANGEFHWAEATISKNSVLLSSPQVAEPCRVRYNWADNPTGNLTDKSGLPAAPFRR